MCPFPRKNFSTKPPKKGVYTHCKGIAAHRFSKRLKNPLQQCLTACALSAGILLGGCDKQTGPTPDVVRIDAAASIAHVIEEMSDAIQHDLNITIAVNSGGSGTLAQQIIHGNQTDLFISADTLWMDQLSKQGLIDTTTRTNLAGNRLVLVALTDSKLHPQSLTELSEDRYQPIAIGDPAYVPAGRYAIQAFQSHNLDSENNLNLAQAPSVRAALSFLLTGQCPVALVYLSDAQKTDEIQVLLTINPNHHDPIRYPAAILKDAPNPKHAQRLLDWLKSNRAQSTFHAAGFIDPQDLNH